MDADTDVDADADGDSDADSDADSDGDSDADSDADSDSEGEVDTDADSDSDGSSDGGVEDSGAVDTGEPGDEAADGVYDLDALYILWNGLYVGGEPTLGSYDDPDSGESVEFTPQYTFAFVDRADHTTGGLDFICYARYDAIGDSIVAADFTVYPAGEGYSDWTWRVDTLLADALYQGRCDDTATLLGVDKVDDYLDGFIWGLGWGPMTAGFASEYASIRGSEPTSSQGVAYLEWNAAGVESLNAWSTFEVYPIVSGTHFDPTAVPYADVGSSSVPYDGYYETQVLYVLTFAR